MTPTAWLLSGDTGVSSKTIFCVMTGHNCSDPGVPRDPSDLGRCIRLLAHFPEWRDRLGEVAKAYPRWGPLVDAWDELEMRYRRICEPDGRYTNASYNRAKDEAHALYDRMHQLFEDGLIAAGWVQTSPGCWESPSRRHSHTGA